MSTTCSRASFISAAALAALACSRHVPEPVGHATEEPPAAARPVATMGAVASAAMVASARAPAANASVPSPAAAAPGTASASPSKAGGAVRFAVIGDYGAAGPAERAVSDLVKGFHPDFVITTGDNNYPVGSADTIDDNIGQFYAEFIHPYVGKYGPGARENRFFPALGNHDYYTDDAAPYLAYFTLPGNERYYTFSRGPVDFFALDSDPHEPDGAGPTSRQAFWLKEQTSRARGAWQIAYLHHPPFSSGPHGSTLETQWPYREDGIDLVLAGHDHTYERFVLDGVTFLVNGLGGNRQYEFKPTVAGSQFRYNAENGAQLATATRDELRITFVAVDGTRVDEVVLKHDR